MNQPDMDTERRLLLAIALSMGVLLLTPYFYQLIYPPEPLAERAAPLFDPVEEPADPPPVLEALPEEVAELEPTQASPRVVRVENEEAVWRWSNMGAVITGVQLKHYRSRDGEPLELIPQDLPEEFPQPLAIRLEEPGLDRLLEGAVFELDPPREGLLRAPADLNFVFRRGQLEVVRKVQVPAGGYTLEVATEVRVADVSMPFTVSVGAGIGEWDPGWYGDFTNPRSAYFAADSLNRYAPGDLKNGALEFESSVRWVGLDSKYFSYVLLGDGQIRGLRISLLEWSRVASDGNQEEIPLVRVDARLTRSALHGFYAGPKQFEALRAVDSTLDQLIDFGWFDLLVKPLLFCLKFIYAYVHNYGWAIIILTFIINLALFPIRYKQLVSMKKLSELQPKMRSIQDKYKRMKRDDPRKQQMNQEVMALYKQHGVNPLGGCLPLVIQMPFLFAFYRMLDVSIELRAAPFILWIDDLSQHDPYYITPVVMGATMLAQQLMMPGMTDPMQRRMMMMLPIVFTFFFMGLSSGLVIYFLFSNVFAMMFQVLMQKWNPELAAQKPSGKASKKQ